MFCSTSLAERTTQFYVEHQQMYISKEVEPTSEEVVFNAYDKTRPTRPASTPVVMRANIASKAVTRIIMAPTNSNRIASHRFTEMLGK